MKQEAYLGGYGSFVNDCLPDFLKSSSAGQGEDTIIIIIILKLILFYLNFPVGYRKRKLVKGIRKAPPLSGDTFLQLEIADNPLSGKFVYMHIYLVYLDIYCRVFGSFP